MTEEKLVAKIKEIVSEEVGGWNCMEDGTYRIELFADYRDEIDAKSVGEIASADDSWLVFCEKMDDAWFDAKIEAYDELKRFTYDSLTEEDGPCPEGLTEEQQKTLDEFFENNVYVELPADHYLKQEYCCTIMIDTGDGNCDYTLNTIFPHYGANEKWTIDEKSSILWLARQQGYNKTQLKKALKPSDDKLPDGFLKSVRTELLNCSTQMNTLTFLVKMTLQEIIELNALVELQDKNGHKYDATKRPYCGYIILGKNTECGLFDPWNGAGSVLEICLEKDVRIPVRFIRSALPDGEDGWGVGSVYGVVSSLWRNTLKKIHAPTTNS